MVRNRRLTWSESGSASEGGSYESGEVVPEGRSSGSSVIGYPWAGVGARRLVLYPQLTPEDGADDEDMTDRR